VPKLDKKKSLTHPSKKPAGKDDPNEPSFSPATPEMKAEAKRRCRGSHGAERKQCMVDILFGVPAGRARKIFDNANLLDKEKCLKRCMVMDHHHFAMFEAAKLPSLESSKEGVSLAFWWNPDKSSASKRCIMLERGKDFFVTQRGLDLAVGAGDLHCTVKDAFLAGKWAPVTITVHHERGLSVYVNDKPACADARNSEKASVEDKRDDLLIGGADSRDTCSGRLAHLYYIPQTVTRKEVKQHGQISPMACVRPKDDGKLKFV